MEFPNTYRPFFTNIELPDAVRKERLNLQGYPETGIFIKDVLENQETTEKISRFEKDFFTLPEAAPQMHPNPNPKGSKWRKFCKYTKYILLSPLLLAISIGALLIVSPILIVIFIINAIATCLLLLTRNNWNTMLSYYRANS